MKKPTRRGGAGFGYAERAPAATDDGLDQKKLEAVIETMVRVGNIRPGKTPVSYDRLVDRSIWRDAAAMVK